MVPAAAIIGKDIDRSFFCELLKKQAEGALNFTHATDVIINSLLNELVRDCISQRWASNVGVVPHAATLLCCMLTAPGIPGPFVSTYQSHHCLTCQIGRGVVLLAWYGRK